MRAKPETIEAIRKRFRREWLLIKVKSVDKATTTPLTGRLIVHSPHLDEIYKKLGSHPDKMLIDYSEDDFPNGYAAAFCA